MNQPPQMRPQIRCVDSMREQCDIYYLKPGAADRHSPS